MNMRWPIIISLGCLTACAGAIPENREAAFIYAVDQLKNGRAAQSASAAWRYAKGATVEDPRYDRALRLLARSAERMGLSYAAAQWYRDIAQGRRDPELMSEAIRGLKIIIESGAFDEDALVEGFIAATSIEGLPESLQAFGTIIKVSTMFAVVRSAGRAIILQKSPAIVRMPPAPPMSAQSKTLQSGT